jgi:hypothetical protein
MSPKAKARKEARRARMKRRDNQELDRAVSRALRSMRNEGKVRTTIRCGPCKITDRDFTGKTIEKVRAFLHRAKLCPATFSEIALSPKLRPRLVTGEKTFPLSEKYRLRRGDVVDFPTIPGVRCDYAFCQLCQKKHCFYCDDCGERVIDKKPKMALT